MRRRRRFWDDSEKQEIVAQTRVPGVSVSQVARRYNVNANLVFKWLRDPRFVPVPDESVQFVPVELVSARPASTTEAFVAAPSTLEIALPSGHRLSVSGAFDPDALARLIRGLGT